MKKINLAVTGCLGRMGSQIIKSARADKRFKLVTITENKKTDKKIFGLKISTNNSEIFKKTKGTPLEFCTKNSQKSEKTKGY